MAATTARKRYRLLWGDQWLIHFNNKGAFWGKEEQAYDIDTPGTADILRQVFEQKLRERGFANCEITIVCVAE